MAAVTAVVFGPGCLSEYSECGKEVRCFAGPGGLGGFAGRGDDGPGSGNQALTSGGTASGSGTSPGGEGGGRGYGGERVSTGAGAARLGERCAEEGERACAGHASRFPLVCEGGLWSSAGQCAWDERCVTAGKEPGACHAAIPECLNYEPGEWACAGEAERVRCGVDLLDVVEREDCLGCDGGACLECIPEFHVATCSHNSVLTCSEAGKLVFAPCPANLPHCSGGACGLPPSCRPTCSGAAAQCCASSLVVGGSFKQNDNPDRPATVSTFRLDDGEVTNLRFVKFKTAWDNGWRPAAGSGKHSHLRAGAGLLTMDGASETGWSTGWAIYVDLGEATRTGSDDVYATWGTEVRPVNFVNFYEAYAFCIWDGGFLPSAAEWSYASSGGAEQRAFPWGATVPGTNSTYAIYGCWYRTPTGTCANVINIAPVGATNGYPALFGQFDLAGNVAELVLGGLTTAGACDDCLELAVAPGGFADQVRGGAFNSDASALRNDATPPSVSRTTRSAEIGFRCARPP